MTTPTYSLIASQILTSPAASISFTGIDQSYRDLRLITTSNTGTVAYWRIRVNGDSGSSYNGVRMYGNGISAYSDTHNSLNVIYGYDTASTTSASFDFMDYSTSDKHKSILGKLKVPSQGVYGWVWRWANTSAITQIDVFEYSTGNLPAGFGVYLYGIAG